MRWFSDFFPTLKLWEAPISFCPLGTSECVINGCCLRKWRIFLPTSSSLQLQNKIGFFEHLKEGAITELNMKRSIMSMAFFCQQKAKKKSFCIWLELLVSTYQAIPYRSLSVIVFVCKKAPCYTAQANFAAICFFFYGQGLSTAAPPVGIGPSVRPDTIPLPPGTHLLFAQSGKIEHVPLEGNNMKKNGAKALLHVPVSNLL